MSSPAPRFSEEIQQAASAWLARRDRGLTAAEQDAYLEWLRADPAHAAAMKYQERVWSVLDHLEQWRPAHSAAPNPDLLAPPRSRRPYWLATAGLALAAAVAVLITVPRSAAPAALADRTPRREAIVHPAPERRILDDGSVVELNRDAKIEVVFTAGERRVKLLSGEAYFTVAKNPARPFIVEASGVAVRAIGTAFSVALGHTDVAVLVTQGSVQVLDQTRTTDLAAGNGAVVLGAGQRTVVRLIRLRPADNVDAFVRLLDSGFGIQAEPQGDELQLHRVK
jgi:transmembrane sensor